MKITANIEHPSNAITFETRKDGDAKYFECPARTILPDQCRNRSRNQSETCPNFATILSECGRLERLIKAHSKRMTIITNNTTPKGL